MKVVANDFGIWDLTNEDEIKRFLNEIHINDDAEIIIDISDCLVLYETAIFIDDILKKIHNAGKQRKLIIYTNLGFLSEDSLYDYLFKKSFIIINNNNNIHDLKNIIISKIKKDFDIDFNLEMPHDK
jgi:archaellum biogenesis ATPase FlaH